MIIITREELLGGRNILRGNGKVSMMRFRARVVESAAIEVVTVEKRNASPSAVTGQCHFMKTRRMAQGHEQGREKQEENRRGGRRGGGGRSGSQPNFPRDLILSVLLRLLRIRTRLNSGIHHSVSADD